MNSTPIDPLVSQFLTVTQIPIIESLPMLWLAFVCLLDLFIHFSVRAYYCNTLDEIRNNLPALRGADTDWKCENPNCPISHSLNKHKNFRQICPELFYYDTKMERRGKEVDAFWDTILKGFIIFSQASYFEVIAIQFFIVYLLTDCITVKVIAAIVAIIFAACYLFLSHFAHEPVIWLTDRRKRAAFACIFWVFTVGLLS